MISSTLPAAAPSSHVEAYYCTGTSPGRTGHALVRLELEFDDTIDVEVGYELHGPVNAAPIVVLGGISAGRHLAPTASAPSPGWWPGVVGPGLALDPTRHCLLGINYVAGVTPDRPDRDPSHSASLRAGRPITSRDQARALVAVLDQVGIESVTLIGSSYGGMVGLAFAELYASRVLKLVILCAAHRTHPMATALRAIQRLTVRFAEEVGCHETGLSLARARAESPSRSSSIRRLSESIDLHAVDPAAITAPATLVSVDTDALVPPWLVDELAEGAPGVERHITLSSVFGHDAFLKEAGLVSDVIRSSLPSSEATR